MALPKPTAYQRAGPLIGLPRLLRELGASPSQVTEGLDVDLDVLTADTRLSFGTAMAILQRSVEVTGCDHVGLLLGARYAWRSHGLIHDLTRSAPTLRRALLDFVTWQIGFSSGATIYLNRFGDSYAFGYGVCDRFEPGARQLYELGAALGLNMIRELTHGAARPDEVLFCHDAPEDVSVHARFLKVPVRFNQHQCCIILSPRAMDQALPTADPARHAEIMCAIGEKLGVAANSIGVRLRSLIRPQILKGDPSMAGAARQLGLHPRTLRRYLAEEGLTFEAVRDDVRYVAARDLLALTGLPIGEVAAALAFSSHAAFVEAFRRWSGTTPTQWRRSARAEAAPRLAPDIAAVA